jgi:hypothetical protein
MEKFIILFLLICSCSYDNKSDLGSNSISFSTDKLVKFNAALNATGLEDIDYHTSTAWNQKNWQLKNNQHTANEFLDLIIFENDSILKNKIQKLLNQLHSTYTELIQSPQSAGLILPNENSSYYKKANPNSLLFFNKDFSVNIKMLQHSKETIYIQPHALIYEWTTKSNYTRLYWNQTREILNLVINQGEQLLAFEFINQNLIRFIHHDNFQTQQDCWSKNEKYYLPANQCPHIKNSILQSFLNTAQNKRENRQKLMPLPNLNSILNSEFPPLLTW